MIENQFKDYKIFYYIDEDLAPFISKKFPEKSSMGIGFRKSHNKILCRWWVGNNCTENEVLLSENNKNSYFSEHLNPIIHPKLLHFFKHEYSQLFRSVSDDKFNHFSSVVNFILDGSDE